MVWKRKVAKEHGIHHPRNQDNSRHHHLVGRIVAQRMEVQEEKVGNTNIFRRMSFHAEA
jgi:hypothetical protein